MFATQVQYAAGSYPGFVTIGDFSGDGKLDAAILNETTGTVSIRLGNGDGTLRTATTLNGTGGAPSQAVAGDFNGDGNLDLAVTSILGNVATIFLGNGDGTFRAPTQVAVGSAPFGIATADFNSDGKLDLVVTNGSSGTIVGQTVRVLLGNGDGTFQSATVYTVGTSPLDVVVGDFDGDGKLDLAVTNADSNTVSILPGNGDGTFGASVNFVTGYRPTSVLTGDFNADGGLDLAIVNSFGVSILLGHGDGTFGAATQINTGRSPSGLAIADFNGDGKLDLAVTNALDYNVSVLLGNGGGTFQPARIFAAGNSPQALAAADLNADGNPELVIANYLGNTISVLLNTSTARSPATLAVRSGTPQSAIIEALFATPLSVVVRDAAGHALPGMQVTFSAPTSGASGTFAGGLSTARALTDVLGVATAPVFTANFVTGTYLVSATVTSLSATFLLTNLPGTQPPVFTSSPPPAGQIGAAYSYRLTASGVPGPSFAVTTGALPTGLALASNTGAITGTPTTAGQFSGVITASNSVNPPGTQAFSIAIAPGNQTISFAPIGNHYFGPPFTFGLSASASSGLPISFSSLTASVCTVSGNTVSMVFTGTCTIRASQTGDGNYAAATAVDRSFNVSVTQIIHFGALENKVFSDPPFTVSATATSGLLVTFSSLTTLVCAVSGNTVSLLVPGICTIRASQAGNASFFQALDVDQSFTVHASLLSQTITFATLSNQAFGTWPFTISATASSGLPVSFASVTAGVCQAYGNTVTVISAGRCTIRASQAGNADYAPAPNVDRSFTVTPASQTIDVFGSIASVFLGFPPRELYARASSYLGVSFVSLTPATCRIDANRVTALSIGTCTIRASQGGDENFSAAPDVEQSFPITAGIQYVTFWPIGDHLRGEPPIQVSASATSGLPITLSSLTPSVCLVNGSIATLVAGGTCTLHASQAGSAEFQAASSDRSFLVLSFGSPAPPAPFVGPLVVYSTYLGSPIAFDILSGPDGGAYVGGSVATTEFPGLSSATFTNGGLDLLYVAKMGDDGSLDFATAVGGRASDITGTGGKEYVGSSFSGAGQVEAMAKDLAGNVYVAAYANSTTFPVSGGNYSRSGPKYIFRITPSGTVQPVSTPIDPAVSSIRALAVDGNGSVYFTGVASPGLITSPSAVIPSVPAATTVAPYLIKLAPGGATTAFSTYLSIRGSRPGTRHHYLPNNHPVDTETTAYALTVDASGNSYLAGQANTDDFPVTPGAAGDQRWTQDTEFRDAFVAKVNPGGTAFVFVARLDGASPGPPNDGERATSIALSPDGGIVIGGKSATYPFYGSGTAFQRQVQFLQGATLADREIGFIAKLFADGSDWQFVAPIGASGGALLDHESILGGETFTDTQPVKVAVDGGGAIYAVGTTSSNRLLPVTSNLYGVPLGSAFIMKLAPDASRQIYSTTLEGGVATGLALDSFGNAYVAGYGFMAKLNDRIAPLTLASDTNPGNAGRGVSLSARLADSRFTGTIEFRDAGQVLGTAPLSNGSATLPMTFTAGVHRLSAIYHGSGPFDGSMAPEVIQVINQGP